MRILWLTHQTEVCFQPTYLFEIGYLCSFSYSTVAPIMNAPPYMMNGAWYPGMEHMEQPPSDLAGDGPSKEGEQGAPMIVDGQQPDGGEQGGVEDEAA